MADAAAFVGGGTFLRIDPASMYHSSFLGFMHRCAIVRRPYTAPRNYCVRSSPVFSLAQQGEDQNQHVTQESIFDEPLSDDEAALVGDFHPDMPLLNTLILTGRLGRDPELKTVGKGTELCKFSMAVTNEWDPLLGPDQETTSWFDVEAWGSLATKIGSSAKKGMRVGISGSINVNTWTGADGELRSQPIVTAETFETLQSQSEPFPDSSRGSEDGPQFRRKQFNKRQYPGNDEDEKLTDLPF